MTTLSGIITAYQSVVNAAISSTGFAGMYYTVATPKSTSLPYFLAGYAFADPTAFKLSCMGAATATATCMNSQQLNSFDGTIFFVVFTDGRTTAGSAAVYGICLPNPISSALL